jgi:ethanolamine utilization protein EutN
LDWKQEKARVLLIKIIGTLVATRKDPNLEGGKLLIGKEIRLDGTLTDIYHVAYDTVGSGEGEVVVIVRGSSARMTPHTGSKPIDSAIIAIVDEIALGSQVIYRKE